MAKAVHLEGTEAWQKEVLQSPQPVLVDFFAEWCGPCKVAAPIMDKLAGEYADKIKVVKIDVDAEANHDLVQQNQVMSIPTVVMYVGGQAVNRKTAFIGEDGYRQMISKTLKD